MAIEKIKILGAVLELPAKLPIQPIWPIFKVNRLNWQKLAVLFSWQFEKVPQDFDFFQLSWVPIIHLCLFPLRPMPPNLLDIIFFS